MSLPNSSKSEEKCSKHCIAANDTSFISILLLINLKKHETDFGVRLFSGRTKRSRATQTRASCDVHIAVGIVTSQIYR